MKQLWKRFARFVRRWATVPARWRQYQEILDADSKVRREFANWAIHFGYSSAVTCSLPARLRVAAQEMKRLSSAWLHRSRQRKRKRPIPGLSAAEIERLALLAEECGEVVKAVCKVLRHGYRSESPFGGPINRVALEREIGNVRAAIDVMIEVGDVRRGDIAHWRQCKRASVGQWLHHQPSRRAAPFSDSTTPLAGGSAGATR